MNVEVNTHILCDPSASDVKLWQVLSFITIDYSVCIALLVQTHLLLQNLKQTRWDHMPVFPETVFLQASCDADVVFEASPPSWRF